MTPKCVDAMTAAAGRPITATEARGIEERVRKNMKGLAEAAHNPKVEGFFASEADRQNYLALPLEDKMRAAAELTGRQIIGEAAKKKRDALVSAQKMAVVDDHIAAMAAKGIDGLDALERTLYFNADGKSNFFSADTRAKSIARDAIRQLRETIEATEPRLFGLMANKDGIRALQMELRGEDSGSAIAKEGARVFHEVAEQLRLRFNRSGGNIPALEDWGNPQSWEQDRVFKAGREQFIQDFLPRMKREKYLDVSGRLMNDEEMTTFLGEAFKTISSGGINKIKPSERPGSGKIANRGDEARQIHLNKADDYIAMQQKYGTSTLEQTLAHHLNRIARDIAMVETYGANAEQTFGYLTRREAKAVADSGQDTSKVKGKMRDLDNLFNFVAGRQDPIASKWMARYGDVARDAAVFAHLGSSSVTAFFLDPVTVHLTARVNNLPALQVTRNILSALNPADAAHRRILKSQGLGLETMIAEVNRWGNDALGNSWSSKTAQTVMQLTGIDALDFARRAGTGAVLFDSIGGLTREHARLADLAPEDAGLLQKKGITETDWQVWRLAETENWGKGNDHVLSPDAIMRIPDAELANIRTDKGERFSDVFERDPNMTAQRLREEATTKLLGAAIEEGQMAVPLPGAKERLLSGAGTQRGTVQGVLLRALMTFKTFPLTLVRTHWMRGMGMPTVGGRAAYIASLVVGTTIMGNVANAVFNLLAGKDPQKLFGHNAAPLEIAKNWVSGFLKGGSAGLYGDFLLSGFNKNGAYDLLGTMGGPTIGLIQDALNLTAGNAIQWAQGKPTHVGSELVKFGKGLTPGASLWYAKAALDHLIFQQAAEYLSPGYLSRMQNASQTQYNERFWWKPGTGPSGMRPPNLGRVVGENP